jgi:membrane associated rhomboid family serine protease
MFPLKIDNVPIRFPIVTIMLIVSCFAAFIFHNRIPAYSNGLVPVNLMYSLFHPQNHTGTILITLIAAFFMHAGLLHLISNMWYLWIFGSALEYTIGIPAFTGIYLISGILSMIIQAISTPLSTVPIVGASGAIAGIMGAFLIFLPLSKVLLWVPPVFLPRVPAFLFLILWFVIQYVSMQSSAHQGAGIAWWAHIGGFATGLLIGLEFRRRRWAGTGNKRKRRTATA